MKYSETCRVNCKVKPSCRKKFYRTKLQEKVDNIREIEFLHPWHIRNVWHDCFKNYSLLQIDDCFVFSSLFEGQ